MDSRQTQKIKEATRGYFNRIEPAPGPVANPFAYIGWWAYSTGGIPAATESAATDINGNPILDPGGQPLNKRTPGSATCCIYYSDATGVIQPYQIPDPTNSDPAHAPVVVFTAPVFNWSLAAIPATVLTMTTIRSNRFYIINSEYKPWFVGKATVDIAARSGAALAAGGQVDQYYNNSGTLTATGRNVIAYCSVSRTTAAGHGIDAGTWCWVEQDGTGTYWASPLDCT
jgi:hypothetical protein